MNMIKHMARALPVLALLLAATTTAKAAENLVLHHFLGPKAPAHAKFMAPWAKRLEEASGGRLKVEIYPSMALGGKPPELYRQLRDGAADIVWTLIGYTPGVFPRSEVFELPSVHRGSAAQTNAAIQSVFNLLADDFKDIKPLLVHVHTGQALHMVDKQVKSVADLAGLKLRVPSRTGAWVLESWNAEPVGMPLPALPQALSKGAVDGGLIPFEVVRPLKIQELTRHSVEGRGGQRFGTSVFLFAMNKDRYEALPANLQKIIDDHSGSAIAVETGRLWDSVEESGKQAQLDSGGTLTQLSAVAQAEMNQHAAEVETRWLSEADGSGLDGKALITAAKRAIAAQKR